MKNKIKLVAYQMPYQSESLFQSRWFMPWISDQFEIRVYNEHESYPDNTVFLIGARQYIDTALREKFWNRCVLVDGLWESNTGKYGNLRTLHGPRHLIMYGNANNLEHDNLLFVPRFFWINESLHYQMRGYDAFQPAKTYSKKFLMPIGTARGWRDETIEALKPWLDDAYWSCVKRGHYLPGTRSAKNLDHRLINPAWYNDTYFSIVCESAKTWTEAVWFLTEKTYKAMAGYHPFVLMGAPGLLAQVQALGFVTFDNIFDESYDHISDLAQRLEALRRIVQDFEYQPYSQETKNRLAHNRNRFYDNALVIEYLKQDIITPIVQWIETHT